MVDSPHLPSFVILLLLAAPAVHAEQTQPSVAAAAGCPTPLVDGDLDDLFDFALCIDGPFGCGHVVLDDPEDVCVFDELFDPCVALTACDGGGVGYFANGGDIVAAAAAHDRDTDITFLGVRTAGPIGDADGDGSDSTGGPCDGTSIVDEPGIGPHELYLWAFDFDCDGIFGEAANQEPIVTVTNNSVNVLNVVATAATFQYSSPVGGTDLEARIEGVPFPRIWRFRAFAALPFAGMGADNAASSLCPEPNLSLSLTLLTPPTIALGAQARITAVVRNASQADLTGLALDLSLSGGLAFVAFADTNDWSDATPNPLRASTPLIAVDESRALTIIVEMVGPCRTVPETIGATVDGSFSESGCVEQSGTQSTANRTLRCATLPTSVAWTWNDDVLEAKPNPFTKSTRVTYAVIASSTMHVEIGVYDSAGRRVRALVSGRVPPGRHDTVWDGTDDDGDAAPAGVYFCRAVVGTRSSVVRVIRIQ